MKMLKDSKAVSPVIGVMLMLVVTVILAAAVSSTSSGLMKSSDAAPTAIFDVEIVKDTDAGYGMGNISYLQIKEVTGDSISTNDLKVVITANGTVTESLPDAGTMDYTYSGTFFNATSNATESYSGTVTGSAPIWNNPAIGSAGDEAVSFGNYNVKPGVSMIANLYDNYTGTSGLQAMISNWNEVNDGDFINVKIVHMPTQKVIFTTNVEVV